MKVSKVDRACKVNVIMSSGRSVAELINIEIQARVWQITTSFLMGLKLKWYKRPAHNGEIISSNLIRPTNLKTFTLLNYLGFPDTCLTRK